MKCAIMQPTYLPWSGYFALIASVDVFVFLDDVQFERRSWQSRNRILLEGEPVWLTVPVRSAPQTTALDQIEIHDADDWRRTHVARLHHAFAKHPQRSAIEETLAIIQDRTITQLAELNMRLIRCIAQRLGLQQRFERSSLLHASGKRSQRLIDICRKLECDVYLSPPGSAGYIEEDNLFADSGIELRFHRYEPPVYRQVNSDAFVSHLSVLDLVANVGWPAAQEHIFEPQPPASAS